MGRKNYNGRARYTPLDSTLAIEFNPQPRAVTILQEVTDLISEIDVVEVLYCWLVLCVMGVLFLPSVILLVASL